MGDRVSVSFVNGKDESVVLFAHWGGREFVQTALDYIQELDKEIPKNHTYPLERREPDTVMVDFVRWLTRKGAFKNMLYKEPKVERVMSSFYFGKTEADGDNSDNGHWRIDLETGRAR